MVTFDYKKLVSLADEAKKAAKEANAYADDLDKKVKNKISSYSGKHTGNINTAYEKVRLKSSQLRQKATTLNSYSDKVTAFHNTVVSAEKRLTNSISSLMGDFKKKWNIKEPKWYERLLEDICDFLGLGDVFDFIRSFLKDIKAYLKFAWNKVKDWYHFDGGAEIVEVIVAVVAAVALVVINIALTIVSGGSWLVILVGVASALVAIANAFGKISQYAETFGKSHVLHKSANNKIASDTELASWLRRQGHYEAAFAFEVAEFIVAVAEVIRDISKFASSAKNFTKTKSNKIFSNVFKNMKEGGAKLFKKATDAEGAWKKAKNWVKISNGIYKMLTTNNFGKSDGKAFFDTIKAGKDTWDTLVKSTVGKAWAFDYKDGKDTHSQAISDILYDWIKPGVEGTNKLWAGLNHKGLNMNNFKYNAKIDKPIEGVSKFIANLGSPSKQMQFIAEKIGLDQVSVPQPIKNGLAWAGDKGFTAFSILHQPAIGIPLYLYRGLY